MFAVGLFKLGISTFSLYWIVEDEQKLLQNAFLRSCNLVDWF